MLFTQVGKQLKRKELSETAVRRCSSKELLNIVKKTTVLESPFNNVAGLKVLFLLKRRLQYSCFPVNTEKF